jgi:hypothetical protein
MVAACQDIGQVRRAMAHESSVGVWSSSAVAARLQSPPVGFTKGIDMGDQGKTI